MNKKTIIIPVLSLAMGAALAGSISGTVAWFQYSTRVQAAYIGTTAHCSEALEITANAVGAAASTSGFSTELTSTQVASATSTTGKQIEPITYGAGLTASGALTTSNFKKNPVYQSFAYNEWMSADASDYYQFELNFRVKDINNPEAYLSKKLYLTNLTIVSLKDGAIDTESNAKDLYKAVRVHINCGSNNLLFANNGGSDATVTTTLGAKLDLNNDGKLDATPAYEWDPAGTVTAYGNASLSQIANNVGGYTFADDSDPSDIDGTELGTITATATGGLKVTVTMWLEGWQSLAKNPDGNAADGTDGFQKLWDPATYIGAQFGVGFRFGCEAHSDSDHA